MDPVSGDFADDSILALLACRVVPLLKLSSGRSTKSTRGGTCFNPKRILDRVPLDGC